MRAVGKVFPMLGTVEIILQLVFFTLMEHTLCIEQFTYLNLMYVLILMEHTLCLEQFYGCLFQPLYISKWTNCWKLTLDRAVGGLREPFTDPYSDQGKPEQD